MIEKLYYQLYKVVKTTRKDDQPFFNAYIALCFLEGLNLGSIFGMANYFLKYRIPENTSVKGSLIVFGIIILYNYFGLWIKKEEIVSKYDRLPHNKSRVLIWAFIILSFSIFFIVLNYLVEYHPSQNIR
ncbi:hypothetical protein [Pedobacter cryoconitis]|uniref:hypothetical protein n=1 Tax=Pedobacter cryoconitis TaxID=188932 RepID=UPI00160F0D04|nr:hypothetical protein [Pedobacter cryoconitis]MBB5648929.1 drug/metabolite transporter (DMT)-like permease [Pedobacter cryoconitis]